jgi:hypothetical protein
MPVLHAIVIAFVTVMVVGSGILLGASGIGAIVSTVREERRRRRTDILGLRGTIDLLNNRHDHTGGQS